MSVVFARELQVLMCHSVNIPKVRLDMGHLLFCGSEPFLDGGTNQNLSTEIKSFVLQRRRMQSYINPPWECRKQSKKMKSRI
jgi:hypothetical protein